MYAIPEPRTNHWIDVYIGWEDLKYCHLIPPSAMTIRIEALIIMAKVDRVDTDMPIYLGLSGWMILRYPPCWNRHLILFNPKSLSFLETLCAGIVQENVICAFGDSDINLKEEIQDWWIASQSGPMTNWVWFLAGGIGPLFLRGSIITLKALILARREKSQGIFMAGGTYLKSKEGTILLSEKPLVAYFNPERDYVYHLVEQATVSLNVTSNPKNIRLNGEKIETFTYDASTSTVRLLLSDGMGTLEIVS